MKRLMMAGAIALSMGAILPTPAKAEKWEVVSVTNNTVSQIDRESFSRRNFIAVYIVRHLHLKVKPGEPKMVDIAEATNCSNGTFKQAWLAFYDTKYKIIGEMPSSYDWERVPVDSIQADVFHAVCYKF